MAKKHEVIIVGMGLASLAAAARLNELGVKDIGIYTTAYGSQHHGGVQAPLPLGRGIRKE